MSWQQLTLYASEVDAQALADLLIALGVEAVSLTSADDTEVFAEKLNQIPLWSHVKITGLLARHQNPNRLIAQLKQWLNQPDLQYEISELIDQDWVRVTQQQFQPQCFGNDLWICPTHCDLKKSTGHKVFIEPGLAFGTGTHPTTALCLEWVAQHPPKNQTVIDYGCGSGILSLATLAMGANKVYAIDHDEQALTATHNNAALNQMADDQLIISLPEKLPLIKTPYLIANILAKPIIELAPVFKNLLAPNGQLILSGLLAKEANVIKAIYLPDLALIDETIREEWLRLVFIRR